MKQLLMKIAACLYLRNECGCWKNVYPGGSPLTRKNSKGAWSFACGAPGVQPGNVLILGGGVVGENAAHYCHWNASSCNYY